MKVNRTDYVAGFLFSPLFLDVALIRKEKPSWQAGLLNGIGGKVEVGESPWNAMQREFFEEASYPEPSELIWKHFCSMSGINNDRESFGIDFFFVVGEPKWVLSRESEQIGAYDVGAICAGDWKTVGNVPWLVALARDFGKGKYPPSAVQVQYRPTQSPSRNPSDPPGSNVDTKNEPSSKHV